MYQIKAAGSESVLLELRLLSLSAQLGVWTLTSYPGALGGRGAIFRVLLQGSMQETWERLLGLSCGQYHTGLAQGTNGDMASKAQHWTSN